MRRLAFTLGLLTIVAALQAQPHPEWAREDPTRIETAEACGECHVSAYEVWKRTPHARGFKTLHRLKTAEAIAGRMGFKLIKRDSNCLRCHYTPTVQGDQLRAVSGVSCESCHGAGADWIDVHNDYGGKGLDHNSEAPEHRAERVARSTAAGMRRPSDLYRLASSCYGCHSVPDERLVNVGRHSIGSAGFELVAWSQGDIRHNFLDSFRDGDGTANAERGAERKRLMYVAGRALELEHGLRGAAAATEKGVFFKATQRRIRNALGEVRAIAAGTEAAELDEIVATVRGVDIRLGNAEALLEAAEKIGAAARAFLDGRDGTRLASLDPLVEGTAAVELVDDFEDDAGTIVAEQPAAPPPVGEPAAGGSSPSASPAGATAPAATTSQAASGAIPAEGAVKRRVRKVSKHATLDATTCQKCHGDQNAWWFDDAHYASVDPFFERARKNQQIARLYGLSPSKTTRGDALCMDCHGTVVTGRETREVADGVSCQSCHGAAKDYLEPHEEGDKSLGLQRLGYVKALKLGLVELKEPATLAAACADCHYVTDPRLISSGHPSGADFDYASGMAETRHWQSPLAPAGTLAAAYSSELAVRGAVPKVRLARLAGAAAPGPVAGTQAAAVAASGATADSGGPAAAVYRPRTPRARPISSGAPARSAVTTGAEAAGDAAALGLPPFPEIDDSTPVEDVLLLLKERLEQLYRAVRGEP